MGGGYRLFEHTADVGVLATGDSLKEAYANAARGLFSVIVDLRGVRDREEHDVSVAAADQDALLVAWLNELIYLFDAQQLLFRWFSVDRLTGTSLTARCYGERADPSRHHLKMGVKAATYHMLQVRQNSRCSVRVLLDI